MWKGRGEMGGEMKGMSPQYFVPWATPFPLSVVILELNKVRHHHPFDGTLIHLQPHAVI